MRIACSNCGQVMEVPPQMSGQIASCPQCRTNIQIPMIAPGQPQPVAGANPQIPAAPVGGSFIRHYGRGVGITLGILLVLFLFVPIQIDRQYQATDATGTPLAPRMEIVWKWNKALVAQRVVQWLELYRNNQEIKPEPTWVDTNAMWDLNIVVQSTSANVTDEVMDKARRDVVTAWVMALLPAGVGLLAVLGACLPSPVRGIFLWLGGLALMYLVELWPTITGGLWCSKSLDEWLLLAFPALLFMVVGGHGATMRRSGKIGSRLGVGLATLAVMAVIGIVLAIQLPKQAATLDQFGIAAPTTFPQQWLPVSLAVLAWAFLGLMGISLLLGLVNLFAGSRGVGIGGYVCGLLAVIAVALTILLSAGAGIADNAGEIIRSDLFCGIGKAVQVLLPAIFGMILVLSGWGSAWKLDRRRAAAA